MTDNRNEKETPTVSADRVEACFDSRFIKVFGMEYIKGKQYMNATRRSKEDLVALKDKKTFQKMLPDAISCIVIIDGKEPKLLLTYEFRYPVGQYLLSVPAGLIDKADLCCEDPLFETAKRELKEETNIDLGETDRYQVVNPLLFSTPGMTDESNALVSIVIGEEKTLALSQEHAEGTECFDGFVMLTKKDALRILQNGKDDHGIFYSVYTWAALMYFVAGMWE